MWDQIPGRNKKWSSKCTQVRFHDFSRSRRKTGNLTELQQIWNSRSGVSKGVCVHLSTAFHISEESGVWVVLFWIMYCCTDHPRGWATALQRCCPQMNCEILWALHHYKTAGTFSLLAGASGTLSAPVFTIPNICSQSWNTAIICALKVHKHTEMTKINTHAHNSKHAENMCRHTHIVHAR